MTMDSTISKCKCTCLLLSFSSSWSLFLISGLKQRFVFCFSALRKHGSELCSLLKRLVISFSKDSTDLLSALLDFLRQIVHTDTGVSAVCIPYILMQITTNKIAKFDKKKKSKVNTSKGILSQRWTLCAILEKNSWIKQHEEEIKHFESQIKKWLIEKQIKTYPCKT